MTENFIKARFRRMGTVENRPVIDLNGIVEDNDRDLPRICIYPQGSLSAALEDYENDEKIRW